MINTSFRMDNDSTFTGVLQEKGNPPNVWRRGLRTATARGIINTGNEGSVSSYEDIYYQTRRKLQ